jgi:hypothetical protein
LQTSFRNSAENILFNRLCYSLAMEPLSPYRVFNLFINLYLKTRARSISKDPKNTSLIPTKGASQGTMKFPLSSDKLFILSQPQRPNRQTLKCLYSCYWSKTIWSIGTSKKSIPKRIFLKVSFVH